MIDEVQINRMVRRMVEHCTGMAPGTVRPANQPGGASGDSFATVLILNDTGAHHAAHTWENAPDDPDEKVKETADRAVLVTASIQFFRKDAYQLANKLRDRIALTSALQLMQSLGLGFVSAKAVQNLAKVVNENWEGRAAVDIDFYVVSTESDVVATFDRFPVDVSTGSSSTTSEVNAP